MSNINMKIGVVGLGYVGLPLAVELNKWFEVIGYDMNIEKIKNYINNIDVTNEVGSKALESSNINFTNNLNDLSDCNFYIISVPTPITTDRMPNLEPLISATKSVASVLKVGDIVVYESTVYPGTTEEICIPILEKESGLNCNRDFYVGYSPERINPGDKTNKLSNIVKVVSGSNEYASHKINEVYSAIITAGTHIASSIKVAEASKVIENAQRDINIAFMNELSQVFHRMDIDTNEVLEAARTKWNFLNFTPGLVGGHCIGVDPYYFIYKANQLGYHSQIIQAGRKVNEDMIDFLVFSILDNLLKNKINVNNAHISVLGVTFKENTPDTRNSKIITVIRKLKEYGIKISIIDEMAEFDNEDKDIEAQRVKFEKLEPTDIIIFGVPHEEFKYLEEKELLKKFKNKANYVDIKGFRNDLKKNENLYWSL